MIDYDYELEKVLEKIQINGWQFNEKKAQQLHLELLENPESNDHLLRVLAEGNNALMHHINNDGRIRTDYKNNGTFTGRCTHKNPNIASIPKGEMRELFTVRDGNILVGVDASQLDATMLAHYLYHYDQGAFAKKLESVGSIHDLNMKVLGVDRKQAKAFYYAMLYGASDKKLGCIVGGDSETGKKLKSLYENEFVGLKGLMNTLDKRFKQGYLNNLLGDEIRLEKFWTSLNTLLQSASACVMKVFVVELNKRLKRDVKIVAFIHDEVNLEIKPEDFEEVSRVIDETWEKTGEILKLKSKLKGDTKKGMSWFDVH